MNNTKNLKKNIKIFKNDKSNNFRKIETVRPDILKIANQIYYENADLMKRLENL